MRKLNFFRFFSIIFLSLAFFACDNESADGEFEDAGTPKARTLATPANFTAIYDPQTNVTTFTWDKVDRASGYSILESGKNDSVTALKILNSTDTSASVYGYPSSVGTYYYWLLAYNNTEESYLTKEQDIVTKVAAPTGLKCTGTDNGVVNLSWTSMEAVSAYKVYYSTDGENFEAYTNTVTTSGATITLKKYTPKFWYKVASIKSDGNISTLSEAIEVDIDLFSPKNFKAEKQEEYGKVKLSWNKIAGVDGYKIYHGTSDVFDSAAAEKTVDNNEENPAIEISNLPKGTHYFFIKSLKNNDENETESNSHTDTNARILIWYPENIEFSTKTEDSLTLTWTAVDGASSYKFTITDEEGNAVTSPNATGETITISGLSSGTVYNIQMQGVESDGTEGEISGVVTGKTNISKPEFDNENSSCYSNSAFVSWTEVKGATSYEIRYSPNDDVENATKLTGISENYVQLTNLSLNTMYYFWIRAIDSENNYETEWDKERSPTTTRPINIKISKSGTSYILSWENDGAAATKYRVRYCTGLKSTNGEYSTIDTDKIKTANEAVTATSYDISTILNDREDRVLWYYFTVDAWCTLDEQWYQGTNEGYGWISYGFQYGESSQLPTSKTSLITQTSYSYKGYTSTYVYSSTATTSSTYFYFKATLGKTYKIYLADYKKNTDARRVSGSYTYSYPANYMKWRIYDAGATPDSFTSYYSIKTFTPAYDGYVVIEVQKALSSASGYYGIQVVETN